MTVQALSKFEVAVLRMFRNGPIRLPDAIDFKLVEGLMERGLLQRAGAKTELTRTGEIVIKSIS